MDTPLQELLHDVKLSWLELFDMNLLKKCLAKIDPYYICPKLTEVLKAFTYFEVHEMKCCIIGQDPYHTPEVAHGLCFSQTISDKTKLKSGKQRIPPSLRNVFKALIKSELINTMPLHGFLENWAKQGVLLLNAFLTTKPGKAGAHPFWKEFTKDLISKLDTIFLVWGKKAESLFSKEVRTKKTFMYWTHPSPICRAGVFADCDHFTKVNGLLDPPIDWNV